VPLPPAIQPRGRPDASKAKDGVRVELWLSPKVAMPGEWVQALVRTTNLRDTPAWSMPASCGHPGTFASVDARAGIPPGIEQEGNAAVLKRKAVRRAGEGRFGLDRRKELQRWYPRDASSRAGWAFVECVGPMEPRRLGPRASTTERFAWYPATSTFLQPLWPGTADVTVTWPFLGRGDEPPGDSQDLWRRINRIRVTAGLEVGGDGPGTPSIPELVDSALEHPRFRAWVEEDPTRDSWNHVWWADAPGPTYEHNLFSMGLEDAPQNGLLWLELGRDQQRRGVVTLDPWTGEVLRVHCIGPAWPSCDRATVLDEPSG
jgi:hypothetical protein